jgi:hypothetical protein
MKKFKFMSYISEGAALGTVDGMLNNARESSQVMPNGSIIGGLFGGFLSALFEGDTNWKRLMVILLI